MKCYVCGKEKNTKEFKGRYIQVRGNPVNYPIVILCRDCEKFLV